MTTPQMPQMMNCPQCKGSGMIPKSILAAVQAKLSPNDPYSQMICPKCNGTGRVPA